MDRTFEIVGSHGPIAWDPASSDLSASQVIAAPAAPAAPADVVSPFDLVVAENERLKKEIEHLHILLKTIRS